MIANRFMADAQSLIGRFHFALMLRSARETNLITASSFANAPRFFNPFLNALFTDSITFVV